MTQPQHNKSVLLVGDLFKAYGIIDTLQSLPDITLDNIPDDLFFNILTFLESKQIDCNPFNALAVFLEFISPLFSTERIEDLSVSSGKRKLERLQTQLKAIDKGDESLAEQRLKLISEIAQIKSASIADKNELADLQIQNLGKLLGGEHSANLMLWINSLRDYSGMTTARLTALPFVEFIKISNIKTTIDNVQTAHEMRQKAQAAQASQQHRG